MAMYTNDLDRRHERVALAALPPNAMSARAKTSAVRTPRAAGVGTYLKPSNPRSGAHTTKLTPSSPAASVTGVPTGNPFKTPPPAGMKPPKAPRSSTHGYHASPTARAGARAAGSTPGSRNTRDELALHPSPAPVLNMHRNESPGSDMEITPAPTSPDTPHTNVRRPHAEPCGVPRLSPDKVTPPHNPYLLPPRCPTKRDMLTVVFDLDETLVSNRNPGAAPAIQRHYLTHMLRQIEGVVEVVLWTASTENTGSPVMQQIDPKREFFDHVIYRNPKWFTDGSHTKDLKLLGRDMEKVVIIENTPNCCKFNPENALMVEDFVGDLSQHDRTLLNLAQIIRDAAATVKKNVGISQFLNYYTRSLGSTIDIYELTLPASYLKMGKEAAMEKIKTLDPLFRPPLGLYYYIRRN